MGKLRSKDVYIQQADQRYLELETQLISLRKETERLVHEREQLIAQALPEHLKMVAVATGGGAVSLSDVIRLQGMQHVYMLSSVFQNAMGVQSGLLLHEAVVTHKMARVRQSIEPRI